MNLKNKTRVEVGSVSIHGIEESSKALAVPTHCEVISRYRDRFRILADFI